MILWGFHPHWKRDRLPTDFFFPVLITPCFYHNTNQLSFFPQVSCAPQIVGISLLYVKCSRWLPKIFPSLTPMKCPIWRPKCLPLRRVSWSILSSRKISHPFFHFINLLLRLFHHFLERFHWSFFCTLRWPNTRVFGFSSGVPRLFRFAHFGHDSFPNLSSVSDIPPWKRDTRSWWRVK